MRKKEDALYSWLCVCDVALIIELTLFERVVPSKHDSSMFCEPNRALGCFEYSMLIKPARTCVIPRLKTIHEHDIRISDVNLSYGYLFFLILDI